MVVQPRAFVSYSRRDGIESARELRRRLEERGVAVWQDLVGLEGGRDWWTQIREVLTARTLQHVIVLLTPQGLQSRIIKREIRLARQEGKQVSPVKGPGVDLAEVPHWIGHVYDLNFPEQWERLLTVLPTSPKPKRVPFMAPEPPEDFIERPEEFGGLKTALLSPKGDAVAITAALRGAGGFGKTALAIALCHDDDIQEAYFDGILWVTIG